MKDRRSGVPNAKIRIRPATRASDWEDEQSRGIVLAKSLRPSIPFVSNINLTEEFRASGHGSAYQMTQATIPQTNCTGELNPRAVRLRYGRLGHLIGGPMSGCSEFLREVYVRNEWYR